MPSSRWATQGELNATFGGMCVSHITLFGPLLSYQSFACMLWFLVLCFDGLFVLMCVYMSVVPFLSLILIF